MLCQRMQQLNQEDDSRPPPYAVPQAYLTAPPAGVYPIMHVNGGTMRLGTGSSEDGADGSEEERMDSRMDMERQRNHSQPMAERQPQKWGPELHKLSVRRTSDSELCSSGNANAAEEEGVTSHHSVHEKNKSGTDIVSASDITQQTLTFEGTLVGTFVDAEEEQIKTRVGRKKTTALQVRLC